MKKFFLILIFLTSTFVNSQSKITVNTKRTNKVIQLEEKSKNYNCSLYSQSMYFEYGKSKLQKDFAYKLNKIVEQMNNLPETKYSIEGHIDSLEATKESKSLSQKRAKVIYEYLISKGISKSRLFYVAQDRDYPIADNETKEGRAQNRRVEIRLRK